MDMSVVGIACLVAHKHQRFWTLHRRCRIGTVTLKATGQRIRLEWLKPERKHEIAARLGMPPALPIYKGTVRTGMHTHG